MPFTYAQNQRIGGASLISIFAYGNGFVSALHTITDHQAEGVAIELQTEEIVSESGVTPGLNDLIDVVQAIHVGLQTPQMHMNNIALSLGLTLSAPTENTTPDPDQIQVEGGSTILDTFYEVEFKFPQRTDPTKFDVLRLYKAKFRPVFAQTATIKAFRNANLRVTGIKDPNNSGKVYMFFVQGITA